MATGAAPATSLVSPPHRMQRELVGQLQEALLAREAAEAAQRGQQRALAASRTLGAFRQAIKERLAGAFSAWVRALLALAVTAASEQSSLALRNAKALAERRANALGDTRASALVAQEQARQAAEELDAVKRASAATEFRHKGYGVRFKALELAATEAKRKEQAVRQADFSRPYQPEVRERLASEGTEAYTTSPSQMGEILHAETEKWAKIARVANIPKQ